MPTDPLIYHLSLFSGYEGFGLGLRLAGLPIRTIGYVEIDEYCQKLLQARIRDGYLDWAPIIRDVRCADFERLAGLVDLITAGFPCQPHSVAGRRAGPDDPRDLWPDTIRVIRQVRPRYVLLENAGVNLRRGPAPAYAYTVLADLAESGYSSRWDVVSAGEAGAPHLRERWFCISYVPGGGRAGQRGAAEYVQQHHPMEYGEVLGPDGQARPMADSQGVGRAEGPQPTERQPGGGSETVADPYGQREQQPEGGIAGERRRIADGREDLAYSAGPRRQGGQPGEGWARWRRRPPQPERRGCPVPNSGSLGCGPGQYGLPPWGPRPVGSGQVRVSNADGQGQDVARPHGDGPQKPRSLDVGPLPDAQGEQMGGAGQSWPGPGGVDWWTVEPPLGRVVDGHPHRVGQVRALGNGIVPAVVAEFLRRLGQGHGH